MNFESDRSLADRYTTTRSHSPKHHAQIVCRHPRDNLTRKSEGLCRRGDRLEIPHTQFGLRSRRFQSNACFASAFASIVLIIYMSSANDSGSRRAGSRFSRPSVCCRAARLPAVRLFCSLTGLRALFHRDVPHRRPSDGPLLVGLAEAENDRGSDTRQRNRRQLRRQLAERTAA